MALRFISAHKPLVHLNSTCSFFLVTKTISALCLNLPLFSYKESYNNNVTIL